jgi:hypothetical protein
MRGAPNSSCSSAIDYSRRRGRTRIQQLERRTGVLRPVSRHASDSRRARIRPARFALKDTKDVAAEDCLHLVIRIGVAVVHCAQWQEVIVRVGAALGRSKRSQGYGEGTARAAATLGLVPPRFVMGAWARTRQAKPQGLRRPPCCAGTLPTGVAPSATSAPLLCATRLALCQQHVRMQWPVFTPGHEAHGVVTSVRRGTGAKLRSH